MTKEVKHTPESAAPADTEKVFVTSTHTIDWPGFGWGIHAGETRELPIDAAQRKEILSSPHIKSINK